MAKKNTKKMKPNKKTNKNVMMFQLLPNQYEIDLYLCLTKVPVPSIIPYLNETLDLGFDENTDIDMESDCPSTFFGLKTPKAVIVLKDWEDPVYTAPILAHELMHVVTYISSIVSVDIDHLNTSEVWAYFMSFYMAVGMELIRLKMNDDKDKAKKARERAKKKKKDINKLVEEIEVAGDFNNEEEEVEEAIEAKPKKKIKKSKKEEIEDEAEMAPKKPKVKKKSHKR